MQGRTYLCKKLDLSSKVAVVRPADLKYYTKTRDFTDVYVVGGKTAYQKPKVWRAAAYSIPDISSNSTMHLCLAP